MVYRFLYYLVNFLLRVFYRRIHFNGFENIPKDKPLLIVCNHPNGFFEPIILACLFPIDLHFLVRGDLFENKYLRKFLLSTHQIPIYRFKDGIAALKKNQQTINKAIEILRQNKAVLIFAEGSTDAGWKIRPLKKGMAKMAFQCIDDSSNLNLHILPVGMTFYRSENPGTEMLLNVGEAFPVSRFYSNDPKNAKEKMDEMSAYTQSKLEELTLSVEDRAKEDEIRKVWQKEITKSSFFDIFPRVKKNDQLFNQLKEFSLGTKAENTENRQPSLLSGLLWLFAFPGMILWLVPIASASLLSKKLVKQREFKSSIRMMLSAVFSILYCLMIYTILSMTYSLLIGFLAMIGIFIFGFLALFIWEYQVRNSNQY
jgi:1-acyl-sn-glycerol-3-phosphate acyltransferase